MVQADKTTSTHQASEYVLLNAIGSTELQDGKYLYAPANRQNRSSLDPGNRKRKRPGTPGPADGNGN